MAWRSLGHSRGLTIVMIVALALGIGCWYAQHQVFAFLESNTPSARSHVYQVGLERGEGVPKTRRTDVVPLLPSVLLTPRDAHGVLAGGGAHRQTITFGAPALLEPDGKPTETVRVRYATRDLFELFEISLLEGRPWSPAGDTGLLAGAVGHEAVIDEQLAKRLFGAATALGRRLRVNGADVQIVGVVASRFHDRYHLYERFVPMRDLVYLPLAHAAAAHAEPDFQHIVAGGETGSMYVWVELPTDAARSTFVANAEAYLARERAGGRSATPHAVILRSAHDWLQWFAPGGTIMLWPILSGMCLAACVLNLVRMLMVKFASRRHDLGLLRAFGARRRAVMGQLLLEAMLVGLIAGGGGLLLGVALMPFAATSVETTPGSATVISFGDALVTIGASITAALIAALYPAWRLARGTPVAQLGGT
jgi:putative ABC transport system permease protein